MNDHTSLPPMPTPRMPDEEAGRHVHPLPILKAESPWATRIRELLSLHSHEVRYLPYMPLRSHGVGAKLANSLANLRGASAGKRKSRMSLPPIDG